MDEPEVLALIPARGGSKGIPRKNLQLLGGHPLLAWAVASALASKHVTRVVVSTDDEEIADAARGCGATVPFLRPASLAADMTTDLPVFQHALDWLREAEAYRPDLVVQLRPTCPIRPRGLVDRGVEMLRSDRRASCVRSVTEPAESPYKMWRTGPSGYLEPALPLADRALADQPRQLLPVIRVHSGHLDVIRSDTVQGLESMTGDHVLPLDVPPRYYVDIDTPDDLERAAWVLERTRGEIDLPGA
jgi:CMP-N-acetylneuraminic acid synthetase